jgi:hypothetical protein
MRIGPACLTNARTSEDPGCINHILKGVWQEGFTIAHSIRLIDLDVPEENNSSWHDKVYVVIKRQLDIDSRSRRE